MYETSFGFTARPFAASPQSRCYYSGGPVELARKTITECIERSEGPALLIGPAGSGKSLVCYQLAQQFQNQYQVVMLADSRIGTRKALLQNVLFDLGLSYRDMDEGELRLTLIDHLDPKNEETPGLLLLVDEADSLSVELLEEVRMITNLVRDGESRVRLVLAGGPDLESKFADPRLETFNQRIARRCYLHSLNEHQTAEYVKAQIEGVGGNADGMFNDEALAAIFTASDGSPRIINQVCDHALLLNSVSGSDAIDADAISEAWADLQQMPEPWETEATESTPSFIEFGELAAEPAEPAQETSADAASPVEHEKPEQLQDAPPQIDSNEIIADALSKLDSIQHDVAQVSQEDSPADLHEETTANEVFLPEVNSEIAAVEPAAEDEPNPVEEVDPFGDEFEDEETIVDPYQSAPVAKAEASVSETHESAGKHENVEDTILETPADEKADIEIQAEESFEETAAITSNMETPETIREETEAEEFVIVNESANEQLSAEKDSPEADQSAAESLLDYSISKDDTLEGSANEDDASDVGESIGGIGDVHSNDPEVEVTGVEACLDIEPHARQEDDSPLQQESPIENEGVEPKDVVKDDLPNEAAEAEPMHTVQLDAQEMNRVDSQAADNDEYSFDITPEANVDNSEPSNEPAESNAGGLDAPLHTVQLDDAELQAAGRPADESPLHTVQLNEAELAQPGGENQEFFAIDGGSSSEPAAKPGQWSLAEPMQDDATKEPVVEEDSVFSIDDGASESTPVSVMQNMQSEAAVESEISATPAPSTDDRDMIVVEEEIEEPLEDDRPQARRQEYRQLFARLRKSQE